MLVELDAGESDDEPAELWRLVDIVAIACGGHAGDDASMARVIAGCADQQLGAHPSYPDRANFGRAAMTMSAGSLEASIAEQCAALARIATGHGRTIDWVKPHGALYHAAAADLEAARAVLRGATRSLGHAITVIGPPRGALADAAVEIGLRYAREGFADRRLRADGSLVPRSEPDALISDPAAAAAQATRLVDIDVVCVHADTPNALAIARAVCEALR